VRPVSEPPTVFTVCGLNRKELACFRITFIRPAIPKCPFLSGSCPLRAF
jgi:hypothetical protein